MSFIESIRTVLSKYATFGGRARRSEFWWYYLAYGILMAVLYFALIVPGLTEYTTATMEYAMAGDPSAAVPTMPGSLATGYLVVSLVALGLLLPTLAVVVRRLHDTGKSGALAFLLLIPVVNVILLIVWGASAGTPGPNQFGPDPKAVEQVPAA
ncbi:DUF805 domain-containing protein [Promicromonospora sp. NPDC050880]|uniref:DUF805 domain-containing protein n=1 Tax=unclassified Promicromonospora TaxID=2647929 RepID=UPI00379BAFFF